MNSLLYWGLFSILVILLIIFVTFLVLNIVRDICVKKTVDSVSSARKMSEYSNKSLYKYQFDKHDVEDLTRIEGDFTKARPNLSFINEVENKSVERLLKRKEITENIIVDSSLSDLTDEKGSEFSLDRRDSIDAILNESDVHKEKKQISQSVDNLEFCDPKSIDILKAISNLEEKGREVENEMNTFIGGPNDVRFYEINEKYIRLMISLCDIYCEKDELRKRKAEVYNYIEDCQKRLKNRRIESL